MHKWANPTLTCTSCHVYRGDKCDAPCTSKTSFFHSSEAGTWSFGTLVHNNISVVQLKPTKKYLQRLLVPLAFATAKSALYSVGSPAHPKMLAAVANRWADTESKVPSSSGTVTANDDGACLRLAHAQVETEIPTRPRRAPLGGAREYRRLRAFPIWGIHGHIQAKSTFICGINGVGGGGGSSPGTWKTGNPTPSHHRPYILHFVWGPNGRVVFRPVKQRRATSPPLFLDNGR